MTINENAGLQTVNLSGISSGAANQVQTLTVTAASSNPGLIPNPTVNYTSPNATGTLSFAPAANGIRDGDDHGDGQQQRREQQHRHAKLHRHGERGEPAADAECVEQHGDQRERGIADGELERDQLRGGEPGATADGDGGVEQSGIDSQSDGELHESERDRDVEFHAGGQWQRDGDDHGDGQQQRREQQHRHAKASPSRSTR